MVQAAGRPANPRQFLGRELQSMQRMDEELARKSSSGSSDAIPLYASQITMVNTISGAAYVSLWRGRFIAATSGLIIKVATVTTYGGTTPFAHGTFYAQAISTSGWVGTMSEMNVGPQGGVAAADYIRGLAIPAAEFGNMITVQFYAKLTTGGAGSSVAAVPISCMGCSAELAVSPI